MAERVAELRRIEHLDASPLRLWGRSEGHGTIVRVVENDRVVKQKIVWAVFAIPAILGGIPIPKPFFDQRVEAAERRLTRKHLK